MYKVLIVEDDPAAADALRGYLGRYGREHGMDLHVTWVASTFELAAARQDADLVFMDIDLPGLSGMEAAELLRTYDQETPLVFVTNLAQYAVEGYRVDALDFLVKPVRYSDFAMAMERAVRRMRRNEGSTLAVATRGGMRVVATSDIAYVDVANHDLTYHLADGERLVARGTLAELEGRLEGGPFVRASKSCLANMGHIRTVRGDELQMSTGDTIYLSRGRKREALATIADYLGGSR